MSKASVSESSNWVIFGVLFFIVLVTFAFWWKLRPRINTYLSKNQKLAEINQAYNSLRKSRADFVYHYYWAIDSGELREATMHEDRILQIDTQLEKLRLQFVAQEASREEY